MLCYELERSTKIFILVVRFTSVKYVRTNFNSVTCNSLILGWGNVEKKVLSLLTGLQMNGQQPIISCYSQFPVLGEKHL